MGAKQNEKIIVVDESICYYMYLLRLVLKGAPLLGRNIPCRPVLMVPTSSRAKSNNFVVWNKLNSIFEKVMRFGIEEQIEISACSVVVKTAKFTFSKP